MHAQENTQIAAIENEIVLQGRRNNQGWFEPAVGVLPESPGKPPQVFVRATFLEGDDIGPQFYLKTDDLGKTWSNPALCQNWQKVPLADDVFEEPWFGLFHHAQTRSFLAIGQTHFVQDAGGSDLHKREKHYYRPDLNGGIVCSLWNPTRADFDLWTRMELPGDLDLHIYYNGQWHEQEDGTLLIPGYYRGPLKAGEDPRYARVTVLRCKFDGRRLHYIEHGTIISVTENSGSDEPSIVRFNGRYLLTIRNLYRSYVAVSEDGLHFNDPIPWCFDNGDDLGNYNTQQKWLRHRDSLYLVYNRKNELSNGVYRSRAPLFMAEVDTDQLRVRRETERVVFPEKGARMGNFNTAEVAENESWIISGEWLNGLFTYSKKGDNFWVDPSHNDPTSPYNYIQHIGDLLLARVLWR